jgi:hypothetical protein
MFHPPGDGVAPFATRDPRRVYARLRVSGVTSSVWFTAVAALPDPHERARLARTTVMILTLAFGDFSTGCLAEEKKR